jgi:hypothetical protein
MKKVLLAICIATLSTVSFAQKGTNAIGIGPEVGLPMGDFGDLSKLGIGGYVKFLYGIGEAGSVTLTTGYSSFKAKDLYTEALEADKINSTIIPILLGYRHNFSGFYVEPQVGYGIYGVKITGGDFAGSGSDGAFTYAVGIGYVVSSFDIGVRYQGASKDGSTTSLIGIRVGYNISLGGE